MNALLTLINAVAIAGFAYGFQRSQAAGSAKLYWFVFFVKWTAAVALGLVYIYYYPGGDTWTHFEEAKALSIMAKSDFIGYCQLLLTNNDTSTVTHILYVHDRSFIFVKVVSLLCLISGDSYWMCASYFSLLSLFSSWFLYLQLKVFVKESTGAIALAIFFFPSVLFWSSGLLKESVAVAALYFLTAIFIKFAHSSKISPGQWLLVLLSLWIGWSVKYYWTAIFICALVSSTLTVVILRKRRAKDKFVVLGWLLLFVLFGLIASFSHPNFQLERIMGVMVASHDQSVLASASEKAIHFYNLKPTCTSMLVNTPWALFSGIFRPLPWEATDFVLLVASIENAAILLFTLLFVVYAYKTYSLFTFPILFFAATLCIFLALSTPNFGTLSRYRVGFLPFFIFIISYRNPLLNYLTRRLSFLAK